MQESTSSELLDKGERIAGRVVRMIFEGRNNYRVYLARSDARMRHPVVSTSPAIFADGDDFIAHGHWEKYRGRDSFHANVMVHSSPGTTKSILAWLRSDSVKGIGLKTVERLEEHFGERLVRVIGDEEVLQEAGIGPTRAEIIAQAWKERDVESELLMWLANLDLGPTLVARVIEEFGQNARHIIEHNPWRLAGITGIGFKTADRVAKSLGRKDDDPDRIHAALEHTLADAMQRRGHSGLPKETLINLTRSLLGCQRSLVEAGIKNCLKYGQLVHDEQVSLVYPGSLWFAERTLAETIADRIGVCNLTFSSREETEQLVNLARNELGVPLDEYQKNAVVDALRNGICIITGGPGTGKSTTMRVLAHVLSMVGIEAYLCAPTGRASKRLSETTGRAARTLHRMLRWDPFKRDFEHSKANPLKCSWVILDEASMVGTWLASKLMSAIKGDCCVTFVGDVDQLPSVDSGQVLADLIKSGKVHVARLEKTHRVGKGSGIALAALRINKGKMPLEGDELSHNGFHLEYRDDPADSLKRAMEIICDELPRRGYDPMYDIQILTPMRKGILGTDNINQALKRALNPARDDNRSVAVGQRKFTIGDRVMHLRNDYQKAVFNGENGIVTEVMPRLGVTPQGKEVPGIAVDYSGWRVVYTPADIVDIIHSWAMTVHKSQGSEYPVVLYLYERSHRNMLSRNIAYTAVTRAKSECWMIGDREMLVHTVSRVDQGQRFTGLAKRLNDNIVLPHQKVPELPRFVAGKSPFFASPFTHQNAATPTFPGGYHGPAASAAKPADGVLRNT